MNNWGFKAIYNNLINKLKTYEDWIELVVSGFLSTLLSVISEIFYRLAFMVESFYRESTWGKALRRESYVLMSQYLNYYPYRKDGAFGTVILSADEDFHSSYTYNGKNVFIPKWTGLKDESGEVNLYTLEDMIYYNGTVGSLEIKVKEGLKRELNYTALGEPNEKFSIYSDSIQEDGLYVYLLSSSGAVLEEIKVLKRDELLLVDNLETLYCEVVNLNDYQGVELVFGDGVLTRKLEANNQIRVVYFETKGKEGDINEVNKDFGFMDRILDVSGLAVDFFITNLNPIDSGSNIESIEEIKVNAPRINFSNNIADTNQNYTNILEQRPEVYKVKVWAYQDVNEVVIPDFANDVYITGINAVGEDLSTPQKEQILQDLKEFKAPTDIMVWESLQKIYAMFRINAVISNIPLTDANNIIDETLINNYGTLNVDFKQDIYNSNFISTLDKLPSIRRHETELFHLEANIPFTVSNREIMVSFPASIESNPVRQILLAPDTLEVWLKRKIAGVWQNAILVGKDESGLIVGKNGYTIINSNIDYVDNHFSYEIEDITLDPTGYGVPTPSESQPDGFVCFVAYKTQDGDGFSLNSLRMPYFYQITDINPEFVFKNLSYDI